MTPDLQNRILPAIDRALVNIIQNPGPLANRPRQIVSFEKLRERQDKLDLSARQKAMVHFDLAGGIGKTVMFGRAIQECLDQGLRVIAVSPLLDLGDQMDEKFNFHFGDDIRAVRIRSDTSAKKEKIDSARLLNISNQSLISLVNRGLIEPEEWDVVVWDEAHTILGAENTRIFHLFQPHAFLMGFTASGEYDADKNLTNLMGPPVDILTVPDAVRGDLLASIKTSVVFTRMNTGLENISGNGDYNEAELARAINVEARNLKAVETYASFRDPETGYQMFGEQGYAFCAGVDHARSVAALFNRTLAEKFGSEALLSDPRYQLLGMQGRINRHEYTHVQHELLSSLKKRHQEGERDLPILPAILVHGDMGRKQRAAAHYCFDHNLAKVSSNDMIWTLGIDKPGASFALNIAPIRSKPRNIQRGTRVDRLDPQRPDKICYIFDYIDADTWQAIEETAANPKETVRGLPYLFAEVLGWETGIYNSAGMARKCEYQKSSDLRIQPAVEIKPEDIVSGDQELAAVYKKIQDASVNDTIIISDIILAELEAQIARTDCGPTKICNGLRQRGIINLTTGIIEGWLSGNARTCSQSNWDKVIDWLKKQPDQPKNDKVSITDEMLQQLQEQIIRTDCGSTKIFKGLKKEGVTDVTIGLIEKWQVGRAKTCSQSDWGKVIDWLKKQPDHPKNDKVNITDEMLQQLQEQIIRTDCGPTKIFKGLEKEGVTSIKIATINNWLSGGSKICFQPHLVAVMSWLKKQPAKLKSHRMNITDEMVQQLETQITRTGCGPSKICNGLKKEGVTHLTGGMINGWQNTSTKACPQLDWNRVISWLERQPDAAPAVARPRRAKQLNTRDDNGLNDHEHIESRADLSLSGAQMEPA